MELMIGSFMATLVGAGLGFWLTRKHYLKFAKDMYHRGRRHALSEVAMQSRDGG